MKDFISGKGGWHRIFNEERPRKNFLSLFKDQEMALDWLSSSLPALIAATEDAQNLGGVTGIIHGDLRSDNILFDQNGRVFLIDWTNACIGPVILDLAFFISGLAAESSIPAQKLLEIYQDRTGFSFTCRDILCWRLFRVIALFQQAVPPHTASALGTKQHLWGVLLADRSLFASAAGS
jgi:aminoglycoside phosphotransferase (APT) family kinase protein